MSYKKQDLRIAIIVAIGQNNEIGKENKLLWSLPADMKHFKEKTKGHTVIMGTKTFESIGRPLPERRNVVLNKEKNLKIEGVEIFNDIPEMLTMLKKTSKDDEEIFVIGGGQIYKLMMPYADKLYVTEVKAEDKNADTFFPEIIPVEFLETKREKHKKDTKNPFDYDFVEYERFF